MSYQLSPVHASQENPSRGGFTMSSQVEGESKDGHGSMSGSPDTTGDASTWCSTSSGYQSNTTDGNDRHPPRATNHHHHLVGTEVRDIDDDFVMVDIVNGHPQASPKRRPVRTRRSSCSIPRVRFSTSDPTLGVDIAMGETGLAADEPITVGQMMQRTVAKVPHHVALRHQVLEEEEVRGERGTWKDVTYTEYYQLCITAAKSLWKLGLEPFQSVLIAGFNSLQWHVSALGAIFAGGLSCGVSTMIGKEEVYSMARKIRAAVAVVESHSLVTLLLLGKIQGKLPELKAIVQYRGSPHKNRPEVYSWDQFMRLGSDVNTCDIEEKMAKTEANTCAALIYTSGTTGHPKVAMLSHDNLTWSAKALTESYKTMEFAAEHTVGYLPLCHISAQMADIYAAITFAATVHFAQPDALKGSLGQTLKEVKPTIFFGVPRVYSKIMESVQEACDGMNWIQKFVSEWAMKIGLEGNLSKQNNKEVPFGWTMAKYLLFKKVQTELGFQRCKIFAVGGSITRTEVYHYLMSLNIPMMNFYGMSESCGAHCVNQLTEDHWRVGSAGKPLIAVSTKLNETDSNGEGEICFSGRHVFMGYLGDPDKTSRVIDNHGWLRTGDIGYFDDNEFLHITGRTCEVMVLRGGDTVMPMAIENRILSELPFLSHVVVIGDNRPYLTCLMTLSCVMNKETGEPTDKLSPLAQKMMESLGSSSATISGVITSRDKAVFTAITDGLERANAHTQSNTHKIQKWTLLNKDFSIPGGELGPTLKVRRFVIHKKYSSTIETLYKT